MDLDNNIILKRLETAEVPSLKIHEENARSFSRHFSKHLFEELEYTIPNIFVLSIEWKWTYIFYFYKRRDKN